VPLTHKTSIKTTDDNFFIRRKSEVKYTIILFFFFSCAFPFQIFFCSRLLSFYPSLCLVTSVATDRNCDNYTICPGAYAFSYSMGIGVFHLLLRFWTSGAISVLSVRLHGTDTDNFIFAYRIAYKWRIFSLCAGKWIYWFYKAPYICWLFGLLQPTPLYLIT